MNVSVDLQHGNAPKIQKAGLIEKMNLIIVFLYNIIQNKQNTKPT